MIIMHHLAIALIAIMKLKGRREKGEPLHTAMYTLYSIRYYTTLYMRLAHGFRTPFSNVLDYNGSILEMRDHRTRVESTRDLWSRVNAQLVRHF